MKIEFQILSRSFEVKWRGPVPRVGEGVHFNEPGEAPRLIDTDGVALPHIAGTVTGLVWFSDNWARVIVRP